jgi:hypothetical protein
MKKGVANVVASSIGKGLVAGLVGTAAMTVSSSLEARMRHRAASSAPARATTRVLGIREFEDDIAAARFSDLSHWSYGTMWGVVRGLLSAVGLSPAAATAVHGAAIWGGGQIMLPALEVAPPLIFWGRKEVAIDLWHHGVYAVATGIAYRLIDGTARAR